MKEFTEAKYKIKKTKLNLGWHHAIMYLEDMRGIAVLFKDEEFSNTFDALYNIVERHLKIPYSGEIIDYYVMVEQIVIGEKESTADLQPPNID
ncbi:MAG: hypothetical protein K2J16_00310 [Clostridia bacterium]|nr:hypothetical protein [Clostridia bacterium]